MIALKRVLLATDFSECAKTAEEYAAAFADQFQTELHVLHVAIDANWMTPDFSPAFSQTPGYLERVMHEAKRAIDKIVVESVKRGGTGIGVVQMGNPSLEIVKYATENGIDLIIVGTHGHGGFVHLLLGSCAEKIVRKAPCPVLTVRPAGHQFISG